MQPLSIDEAFCDVTGSQRLFGTPEAMARRVRAEVRAATGLTCSVGVATSKFMAKLASDLDKPDGMTIVRPGAERRPRSTRCRSARSGGSAPRPGSCSPSGTSTRSPSCASLPAGFLDRRLGAMGRKLRARIEARDERPVVPERHAKQVSHEKTFGRDVADPDVARAVLLGQVQDVAERLRRRGDAARAVSLKLRFGDFTTITRGRTLDAPTDVTRELWRAGLAVFDAWSRTGYRPLRLLGFGATVAAAGRQMDLFADPAQARQRGVDAVADRINGRFGKSALTRGLRPGRA